MSRMIDIDELLTELDRLKVALKMQDSYKGKLNLMSCLSTIDDAIQTIREVQEQIPKWHLVADELPSEDDCLNSKLCWDEYRDRCVFARFVNGSWVLGNGDESIKVVAWMELPKYESEE